ncbi:MAG: SUMF1/EgtB/PvdO family nonheme iron enzyme, partial [bacterium]|nr:SUMF1/EgtB/PvdO family nonheme iron enzyme [bacterium]
EELEGPDEFTYVVTDGELTAEAVVRVEVRAPTPVNRRPTTQGDQAEATSGQAVKIDVLGNDIDPDGDTLELAGVTAPQHGTAALNDEGTVTYTSKQGFEGTDRFTYLVTDGTLQNNAEVVVEVKSIDVAPGDGPPDGEGATPAEPGAEAPAPAAPAPPPEPPTPPQAGEIRTNGEGGLEYVWIPASPKGFWLGRTEVTIAAYRRHSPTPGAQPPNSTGQHPVVAVKWADADVFCRSTGGRLPTAAEWVYAAQGGQDGLKYPWGEENPVCAVGARTGATFKSCNTGGPQPIKTYTAHGFELYDMAGNVAEWCQDDARWGTKAVHGGSWKDSRSDIQASAEDRKAPDKAFDDVGFRCARDEAPRPVEDE